jgi:hypothetical protein
MWAKVKQVEEQSINILRKHLLNKVLLPVIGNNDVMAHDQMPCTIEQAKIYFGDLHKTWFPESIKMNNQESIKSSFLQGGYYKYDFENKNVSLLALNTMYFMTVNKCMLNESTV